MAGIYTRGRIITEGLQLGDNPGLATRARYFLNFLEDNINRLYDFSWLRKTSGDLTLTAGSSTIDLSSVTDIRSPLDVWVVGAGALRIVPMDSFWSTLQQNTDNANTGLPGRVAYDKLNGTLQFDGVADQNYTVRMRYLHVPTPPDASDAAAYDATTPMFEDHMSLMMAVAEFARRWDVSSNTQSLIPLAKSIATEMMENGVVAEVASDMKAGALRLKLDGSVHKTWRD